MARAASAARALRPSAGFAIVRAALTIDATADAYVAASAGVALQQGDEQGRVQPASLMFRLSHVDLAATAAYLRAHPGRCARAWRRRRARPRR